MTGRLRVLLLCLLTGGTAVPRAASAQEPAASQPAPQTPAGLSNLQIGLTLEGFYQYNANRPFDRINLLRAYDTRANTFGIQQAALVFEFAPDVAESRRFGGRLDLQFGQATEAVQGSSANEPRPDVYRHVWQAYGTYVFDVGRGLTMDFGKFASNLGFETNYAKDNSQFSRAVLFGFLPFYHSGVRLSLPVTERVTLMYMLTNGIQQTEEFNNFKSSHVTAIIKPIDRVSWTVNYFAGQEPSGFFRVFDTYAMFSMTSKLSLGADVNVSTNQVSAGDPTRSLVGAGAYARYQTSARGALSVRYERLQDGGLLAGVAQVLQEMTTTVEHTLADGFAMRAEFRRDWATRAFFTTREPGVLSQHQNTALVGLVWWFGNKPGTW